MKYEKLTEILMESLKDTYYKSPITNYAFFFYKVNISFLIIFIYAARFIKNLPSFAENFI